MYVSSLPPKTQANPQNQVLGAKTVALPETTDFPGLNRLLELSNQSRNAANLPALRLDPTLTKLAQTRADDMALRGYYAHRNPEGLYYYDQLTLTKFSNVYSCENLALDSSKISQTYLDQWLKSPDGHKECLLNSSTTFVGLGVAKLSFGTQTTDDDSFVVVAIQANQPN
jgi:uncharacterized protein YkwD